MNGFRVSMQERAQMHFGAVYVVRNQDGVPIYIGQTSDLGIRIGSLQCMRWWPTEAASIEVAHRSDDAWDRRSVETALIGEHQPVWNVQCRAVTRGRVRQMQTEHLQQLADAGYAQPTALGAGILFVAAILVGLTTPPGVALATVVVIALGRLAFLLGRAALDSERKRSGLVAVEIYPALSRADAARAIEGWHR